MATLETIRLSKNNSLQWFSLNPILGDKEIGVETDTKLFKVGDGVSHWKALAYVASNSVNALFISLSPDPNNLIALTTEGSIFLNRSVFNGVPDYVTGKEQGLAAQIPPLEYNVTMLKVGQDIHSILATLNSLTNRLTIEEAKPVGSHIDDSSESLVSAWSSTKIKDKILTSINGLKADIVANADGAYDALTRLALLLQDNSSLALVISEELSYAVRFNADQTLTLEQKAKARENIGAVSTLSIGDSSVLLTDYQEARLTSLNSPFESNEL